MSRKFSCQNCGADIIIKYLKTGEIAKCKACGAENVVPETAAETAEVPDYFRQWVISKINQQRGLEQQEEDSAEQNPFQRLKARSLFFWVLCGTLVLVFAVILLEAWNIDLASRWHFGLSESFLVLTWVLWKSKRLHIDLKRIIGKLPSRHEWRKIGVVAPLKFFGIGSAILIQHFVSLVSPSLSRFMYPERELTKTMIFSIIIVAPIVEEIVCRGMLIHRWTVKWNIKRAVLVSSLVFAILHARPAIGAFVAGFVWAVLYIRTRSLIIPIVCHMLGNAVIAGIGIAYRLDPGTLEAFEQTLRSGPWAGITLLCFFLSVVWVVRFMYKNWPDQSWTAPYFV